jgi:hypothetical protein
MRKDTGQFMSPYLDQDTDLLKVTDKFKKVSAFPKEKKAELNMCDTMDNLYCLPLRLLLPIRS